MRALGVLVVMALGSVASAAPTPFVTYYVPAGLCDVHPVTQACRNAERGMWQEFLGGKSHENFKALTAVRLTDLFRSDGTPYGGWVFRVIIPVAPAKWKAKDLSITIGGASLDDQPRYLRGGSLVIEVAIDRQRIKPGKHVLDAVQGTASVMSLVLELEDGVPDDPDPIAKAKQRDDAAAKRPPFLVAELPRKPECSAQPEPAGCHRAVPLMWRRLYEGTLDGHPHTKKFTSRIKTSPVSNTSHELWTIFLILPKAPDNWPAVKVELDGKDVIRFPQRQWESQGLIIEIRLFVDQHAVGKHQLRALDGNTELFSGELELVR